MTAGHEILGGKVRCTDATAASGNALLRSEASSIAQPQERRTSPGQDVAEDWYLELRGKFKRGDLGKLVAETVRKAVRRSR